MGDTQTLARLSVEHAIEHGEAIEHADAKALLDALAAAERDRDELRRLNILTSDAVETASQAAEAAEARLALAVGVCQQAIDLCGNTGLIDGDDDNYVVWKSQVDELEQAALRVVGKEIPDAT
jgi:hypothetical protein